MMAWLIMAQKLIIGLNTAKMSLQMAEIILMELKIFGDIAKVECPNLGELREKILFCT